MSDTQKRPPNCGTGYCSCVECLMPEDQRPFKPDWADFKNGREAGQAEAQSDIETLEVENRMLRARNERLERELANLAERVAARLEQSGAGSFAGLIREVFITKSHP